MLTGVRDEKLVLAGIANRAVQICCRISQVVCADFVAAHLRCGIPLLVRQRRVSLSVPCYAIDYLAGHHFAAFEAAWTPVPRLVGMADGTVLELGPGSGNQFPRFNRDAISRIYGIKPNEDLFNRLRNDTIKQHDLSDIYIPINAALEDHNVLESYSIGSGSINTVVCMRVLCSVSNPACAAKHIHRLLKPGGQLLFWEHQTSRDIMTRLIQGEQAIECSLKPAIEWKLTGCRLLELVMDPSDRWLPP
jgi:SAM-dependent methyltransferase